MPTDQGNSIKNKMNQSEDTDQKREKEVYKYLLSFTDLGLGKNILGENISVSELIKSHSDTSTKKKIPKPNESLIAIQWGSSEKKGINRTYIGRVLRCVYGDTLYKDEKQSSWPGLSIAKLVDILSSLAKYWSNPPIRKHQNKPPKVTHAVKLKAIQMLSELSSDERRELDIAMPSGEGLIKKIYEDILNPHYSFNYEELTGIYKQLLTSKTIFHDNERLSKDHYNEENLTGENPILKRIVTEHFSQLTKKDPDEISSKLVINRVFKEINRIKFQSGAEQLESLLPGDYDMNRQISSSRKRFAKHLTKCIVENEEITDEFPIRIKFFEIEKVRPLPLLEYHGENNVKGLINPNLVKNLSIGGLERQYTYKLKIHFLVRYGNEPKEKIEFFEEVTGIGSPISHVSIAIDRVLMWDIPCLKEYFPIAKQHFSSDEVMGESQNSSIWSHCVVQLYKRSEIEESINNNNKPLEEINPNAVSHYGEYCGFDILETSAKASLIARLRAIKHILERNNTTSTEYMTQLRDRIVEYKNLCLAKDLLRYYPFSLGVMEAKINSEIFFNNKSKVCKYRGVNEEGDFYDVDNNGTGVDVNGNSSWSSVAYDAHLKITEALLKEGRTVASKKYLNILDSHKRHLSTLMLARYYLCYGQYHFLSNVASTDNNQNREEALSQAYKCLQLAKDSLSKRLKKCMLLGELSHSNIHPFFEIHSKIFLLRARMYLYFSSHSNYISHTPDNDKSPWGKAKAPLIEAEKARIYSARDGNAGLYSSQSCFQAWVYLILAFTWDFYKYPKNKEGFSKEICIDWAERLLTHSIVCYENTGLKCYADIKRNAGFIVENQFGDNVNIVTEGIPFVQELTPPKNDKDRMSNNKLRDNEAKKDSSKNPKILYLDLSLFKTEKANLESEPTLKPVFFGTDSSNIIFTWGVLELCKPVEPDKNQTTEEALINSIRGAMRKFVIAWSTSRDGAYFEHVGDRYKVLQIFEDFRDFGNGCKDNSDDTKILVEIDQDGDRYIRGFYPHRVSKTAVFSKLFIGVCLLILECKKEENKICFFNDDVVNWDSICEFASRLCEENTIEKVEGSLRQEYFNEHLVDHADNISNYFKDFRVWSASSECRGLKTIQIRDKVMKDIFTLIRDDK
jgi:hypothetical protein